MEKKPFVIGLDLGGTNSEFGIVDQNAQIVESVSIPTKGHGTAEQYVKDCCQALEPIIEKVGGISNIQGMGIGAPNANYLNGCIENAPNLEWKGIVPLAELFANALNIPVSITNDANAAALGEMTYGAAKGMQNFIEITLGTGLGSGIVANGQLLYGSDGFAGELGHVIIEENGRICGCGRKGCLEAYCSGTGIARTALELMASSTQPSILRELPVNQITAKEVSIAAQKGDALSAQVLAETGKRLGKALADFTTFLSPEAYILFGGPTKAGDLLMNPIKEAYEEAVMPIFRGKAKIILSELDGAKAAILGASALGWEI